MKFVPIDRLEPKMSLARPIFTVDGRVLLNAGVQIQDSYIQRLRRMGIPGVYVSEEAVDDLNFPEAVSQKTRLEAINCVREVLDSARVGRTFDVGPVNRSVNAIIDEVASNPNLLINLTDIRSYDGYTFGHCVNVCVLSVMLGIKCQLNEIQLHQLAVGALLHDIGKIVIPESILNKPGPLDEAEREEVKKHPYHGWHLLRQHPEISLLSAHIAYQHHERPNGQGYPRGLVAADINFYAKIVGVADAYDAMTSERIYQSAMMPYEALRLIRQLKGVQFDEQIADFLLESVAIYPVGSLVRLNSGEIGMVVDVNQADRQRPVVRILYRANGDRNSDFVEIDLAKDKHARILEVVE